MSGKRTALRVLSITHAYTKHVKSIRRRNWQIIAFYLTKRPWVECYFFTSHICHPKESYSKERDLLPCNLKIDLNTKHLIHIISWINQPLLISWQAALMHAFTAKDIQSPSSWSKLSASEFPLSCCSAASRSKAAGLSQGRPWFDSTRYFYRI